MHSWQRAMCEVRWPPLGSRVRARSSNRSNRSTSGPMRIALVTPVAVESARGNAVTVARLRDGLRGQGVEVEVVDLSRPAGEAAGEPRGASTPDLVHGFHAFRGGPAAAALARAAALPLVVSLTGTDVNIDLGHHARRAPTIAALREARVLVAFHESIRTRVAREVPDLASRIEVIPQSVSFGTAA